MPSRKRYEIKASCYDKRGKLLAVGYNNYHKSSPMQSKLSSKLGLHEERIYLHAEVHALIKLLSKDQRSITNLHSLTKQPHSIVIERYGADGKPRTAFPCISCQLAIRLAGIPECWFTTEQGLQLWVVG